MTILSAERNNPWVEATPIRMRRQADLSGLTTDLAGMRIDFAGMRIDFAGIGTDWPRLGCER